MTEIIRVGSFFPHTLKNDHVRTQQKVAVCKPGRELSKETKPPWTLLLNFSVSEL